MNYLDLCLLALLVWTYCSRSSGTFLQGTSHWSVKAVSTCASSDNPYCCGDGPCSLKYSYLYNVHLTIDGSTFNWQSACQEHYNVCVNRCRLLSGKADIESSPICKCSRTISGSIVRSRCESACSRGRADCRRNAALYKCPISATTSVCFTFIAPGKCMRKTCPEEQCEAKCCNSTGCVTTRNAVEQVLSK